MNDITTPAGLPSSIMAAAGAGTMPVVMRMYLDPAWRDAIKEAAERFSKDEVWCPEHLRGKAHACQVVFMKAFRWGFDPTDVAQRTYQTPGGSIGMMGSLVNAAINAHFVNGFRFTHHGDWSKVQGKWEWKTNERTQKKYQARSWTDKDEAGLGVTITGTLRGDKEPRSLTVELIECQPRNAVTWATSPKYQICQVAIRRFANLMAPHALMGVPLPPAERAAEIDMGDAVIEDDFEITQPQAIERVDTETGEVVREPQAQEQAQPATGEGPALISERQCSLLNTQLADRKLTEAFCAHFGVPEVKQLPLTKINDAMGWIRAQSEGK